MGEPVAEVDVFSLDEPSPLESEYKLIFNHFKQFNIMFNMKSTKTTHSQENLFILFIYFVFVSSTN